MQAETKTQYSDGKFKPVVEQCDGCERTIEEAGNTYCKAYTNPEAKWKIGICNFATHVKPEITVSKVRINPLKAAKRASKSN